MNGSLIITRKQESKITLFPSFPRWCSEISILEFECSKHYCGHILIPTTVITVQLEVVMVSCPFLKQPPKK